MPATPPAIRDLVSKALCYGGLYETTAWKLLGMNGIDTCKYKAIDASASQSMLGGVTTQGCGVFILPYIDSLKLRANCN